MASIIVACGIDVFDRIAKELEAIVVDPHTQKPLISFCKSDKDFYITKQEFDDFCKGFLFEELKGNDDIGGAFCKKYGQSNYVLSNLLSNKLAKEHIRKFYIQ